VSRNITTGRLAAAIGLAAMTLLWPGWRLGLNRDGEAGAVEASATAAALTGTWVKTGGPLGGLGYDIRVQPDNPDIMYVTDAFAGVFKSTNGGATWTSLNAGIDARTGPSNDAIPVFCLTIDPNNYNTLWIGMKELRGVYKSTDAGATWVRKDTGIVESNGLTIRGIGVKPGDSNTVFAAGEVSSQIWNHGTQLIGRQFDLVQGVIYRSTNGGQTWSEAWRGDNLARYVLFDPTNTSTIYVSTGLFDREAKNSNPSTGAPGGVGVLKSPDGGSTWTALTSGLGNLYIGSLFMSPANPQMLLAAAGNFAYPTGGGIYRTTNGGATWQLVGATTHMEAVEYSTGTPTTAYAASDSPSRFYKSTDSGATWTQVNTSGNWGPAGVRAGVPIDLLVDPRNAQRVFTNNYGGGNFLSADGGQTWTTASTGYTGADVKDVAVDPGNPSKVYAMVRVGPFTSGDGGGTWNGINTSAPEVSEGARLALDPSNASTVLMSNADQGLTYRSTNKGTSWTQVTNFLSELSALPVTDGNEKTQGMQAIAFAPSDPSKVYGGFGIRQCATDAVDYLCAKSTIASIFTSADGGATWTRHNGVAGNRTVSRIVVDPLNASKAWASTLGGGVFITTDGGNTWTASNSGLTNLNVWSLAGTPSNANVLYAGTTTSGIFKSTNGGASWFAASAGMSANEPITSLVVSPADASVVYAGSRATGVYTSTDAGASWTLNSAGLRQRAVQALSLANNGSVLYAATQGEGVYRLGALPASPPTMALDRTSLVFGAVATGAALSAQTPPQTVRLTQTGAGTVTWTASSTTPWLVVSPTSGSGSTALSIRVQAASGLTGSQTGRINLALTGAANTVGPVNVTFTIVLNTAPVSPPFGVIDTPVGDATVLAGSIAVTGWTLDNIGVQRVELWRDLQPGETTPPFASTPSDPRNGKVFIANATFVDGARPDVEALNATTPLAYRAGWGYLLLTWGLWNQGNGTYKLYAFAFDQENNLGTIGTKTVIVSNNAATKPFGSIDTPGIGGDASGPNFGWGLTPKVNGVATCKIQPSGVQVSIDSGPLQPVVYGDARTDIAGAFPGFSNTAAAGGHFIIDWSTLTNGPHTIGWLITDDCNRADGVGSRFFNVTGGTSVTTVQSRAVAEGQSESMDAITVARGYGELPEIVRPDETGSRTIEVKQGGRIEIRVPHGFESAYQLVNGGQRRALPIGATWDAASGTLYWQPAPAFLGQYRIVFTNGSGRISVGVIVTR
jgi:hypothetical protein